MQTRLIELAPGDAGILGQTVPTLCELARRYALDPVVREYAASLARPAGQNREAQAARIRNWLRDEIEFLPDPSVADYFMAPDYLLDRHRRGMTVQGDCDDVALLGAALALSIGFRARYVLVGRNGFEHIFTEIAPEGTEDWLELDTVRPTESIPRSYLTRAYAVEI